MATISPALMHDFHEVGRDLYQLGLVTSHGGNLSVREQPGMWITGTGTMLGRLAERHLRRVYPDGRSEGPPPSSDTVLHHTIYAVTGAGAVVHAHPRHAIALSLETDRFVPEDFEGRLHLTDVPVIAAGARQTEQIATAMESRLVVLLAGHGAFARGQTLWEALHWITALEESAQVAVIRRMLRHG